MTRHTTHLQAVPKATYLVFAEAKSEVSEVLEAFVKGVGLVSVNATLMADQTATKLWSRGFRRNNKNQWAKILLAERINGQIVCHPEFSANRTIIWATGPEGNENWSQAYAKQVKALNVLLAQAEKDPCNQDLDIAA